MAERLLKYYNYMAEINGLKGKMDLAMITKMPSQKAALEPDTPELIEAFKAAIKQLTGKPAPNF